MFVFCIIELFSFRAAQTGLRTLAFIPHWNKAVIKRGGNKK